MGDLRQSLQDHLWEVFRDNPDAAGEALRALVFPGEGYGAYSTFVVAPGFVAVAPTRGLFTAMWGRAPQDADDFAELKRINAYRHDEWKLLVAWHWDGDGHLYFDAPDLNLSISNTDCKKDHGWEAGGSTRSSAIWCAEPILGAA